MRDPMMQRWVDFIGHRTSLDRALWVYRVIEDHYGQRHREYHILQHISQMLDDMEQYFPNASELEFLAVWFHDLIYIPGSTENEAQSAWQMAALLRGVFTNQELIEAGNYIFATQYHVKKVGSYPEGSKRVRDIDLLSLAIAPDEYDANTYKIWRELNLPENVWTRGRKIFIQRMLSQPRIYLTDELYTWFEHLARTNLQRELAKY